MVLSASVGKKREIKSKSTWGDRVASCVYCGLEFISHNPRRMYCSERCRRDAQNERRRDERAEMREIREASKWDYDPWERNDMDDDIYGNALLDATPWTDNPWGGLQLPDMPRKRTQKKQQKKNKWLWLPGVPQ